MFKSTNPQEKRDIFKEWAERRKSAAAQKKQMTAQEEEKFLMSFESDQTHADEAVMWTKGILFVIAAFLVYLSFCYYLKIFSETFSPLVALAFALALPIVVEIGTIMLGQKALRAMMFGWFKESGAALAYWCLIGLLSAGFFYWSYSISTKGIAEVARDNATEKNRPAALTAQIAEATLSIDAQIEEINRANAGASEMKTKRGRVNWTGSQIQQNNSATLQSLQDQRKTIVDQVTSEYNSTKTETTAKVSTWASFIERFGGYGELIKGLAMLAIAFFERRLFNVNAREIAVREAEAAPVAAPPPPPPTAGPQQPAPSRNGQVYNRAAGFHRENTDATGNIVPAHVRETVLQPVATVVQQLPSIGADAVLRNLKTKLQVEIGNLSNPHARPGTVSRRINAALESAMEEIGNTDFKPSRPVGVEVYSYLYNAFETLNERGFPFERNRQFLFLLHDRLPPEPVEA